MNRRIRVIRRHTCPHDSDHRGSLWYAGSWRGRTEILYRDAIGRKGRNTYRWLPLECAFDQDCPASVIIRLDLIEELGQKALEGK